MIQWFVLYCLIFNEKKIGDILSKLKEEYFYDEIPREVYLYIVSLVKKNKKIDPNLIKSRFENTSLDLDVDIELYEEYIDTLRQVFVTSSIKDTANIISSSQKIDENKFRTYINNLLDKISTSEESNMHSASETVEKMLKEINSEKFDSKTLYGIECLDTHTGGAFPGEYTVIAGRPSMGKSGLLIQTAMSNALKGLNTVLFSLEMNDVKIGIRMLSNLAEIELWKLRRLKNRSEKEQEQVMQTARRLAKMPLTVDTTAGLDLNIMSSVLQKLKLQQGKIDIILVDYLQLMSGRNNVNDNSRISELSKGLKQFAVQYNCPIIVGSQLSRMCEQREDKRPILSDLRDSGSIEQDADLVIMLYRDHYYTSNPEHERILELLIRKFRNGEVGKVIVDYKMKTQSMKSMNYDTELGRVAKRFIYE